MTYCDLSKFWGLMDSAGQLLLVEVPHVIAVRGWLRLEASEGSQAGTAHDGLSISQQPQHVATLGFFRAWWSLGGQTSYGGSFPLRVSAPGDQGQGHKAFPNRSFKALQSQFCLILFVVSDHPGSMAGDYPRSGIEGGVVHCGGCHR